MPETFPTSPVLVSRFADLATQAGEAAVAELRAGRRVLVHCLAGRDRTGLVLCASLMDLEGVDPRDALARVRAARPDALTGPGVTDVLDEIARRRGTG
jgi:protein-tyrosine phosphatase